MLPGNHRTLRFKEFEVNPPEFVSCQSGTGCGGPSAVDQGFCAGARCQFYMDNIADGMGTAAWHEMAAVCPVSFCNIDSWLGNCVTTTAAPVLPIGTESLAPIPLDPSIASVLETFQIRHLLPYLSL